MNEFNWTCPYCSNHQTVVSAKFDASTVRLNVGDTADGNCVGVKITSIGCSNTSCKNVTIDVSYGKLTQSQFTHDYILSRATLTVPIKPESRARALPQCIPAPIANDYSEACRISNLSPKASATLARRCLQGMLRDFCGITKPTLHQEINDLKKQFDEGHAPRGVSEESFEAIEAIRKIGNIGAHMEKDINVIVDVEPDEAELLLSLVENLFDDWYIARQKRQDRLARVTASVEEKEVIRKGPSE
ncbi:DUF4145 domain-containing protein [Agrobacterium sp. RAC06]|uniref:DUF4145 domain-containing protein n=1 Tax=Agrobacterium sp. RAC06 TaxID=1842536 RepID=UPI00083DFA25|nr:DUF4145 domain-containing protein [Agrobacterium sp. RAC06]AOG11319.1 hypothetical protein BSY240_936 [Agrobacterium sp. RAC06]